MALELSQKTKVLALRFLRGGVAGAVATMVTVLTYSGSNWGDIKIWLASLMMACTVGFVSGVVLAIEKAVRYK